MPTHNLTQAHSDRLAELSFMRFMNEYEEWHFPGRGTCTWVQTAKVTAV